MIKNINFKPLPGLSSPHLQTILSHFGPMGVAPLSVPVLIKLDDGDLLSCHISNPLIQVNQKGEIPTIVMLHGLGGSHESCYLIRLAKKFFDEGYRVVRINMRGCGSGEGLAARPYNGGTSEDIFAVLKYLKGQYPHSNTTLIGFSLGGNIVLKMAGELGIRAKQYFNRLIAICPTVDIYHAVKCLEKKSNWIYHRFYLQHLLRQSKDWMMGKTVSTIYEYDEKITAAHWGYKSAAEYYDKCSSANFIGKIEVPCDLLFANDDPFIDFRPIYELKLPPHVRVFLTEHGGHMGFLGWTGNKNDYYWMDHILLEWIRKYRPEN